MSSKEPFASPFDFDARKRKPFTRKNYQVAAVICFVAFATVSIGVTAYLIAVDQLESKGTAHEKAKPTIASKPTSAPAVQSVPQKKQPEETPVVAVGVLTLPAQKKPDLRWLEEARLELAHARNERDRLADNDAIRLGSLSAGEFRQAKRNLAYVQRFCSIENPSKIQRMPSKMVNSAALISPRTIRALQLEALMREPLYDKLVKAGDAPARLPWNERQQRYRQFASVTGDKSPWSIEHPFDALNLREMNDLRDGLDVLLQKGFSALNQEQRFLLLKAGAFSFFQRTIDAYK